MTRESARKKMVNQLKRTSFLVAFGSLMVMVIIVLLGNPPLSKAFYWHHIPELVCVYSVGVWAREVKLSIYYVLIIFLLANSLSIIQYSSFLGLIVSLPLTFPLLLGYLIQKKSE